MFDEFFQFDALKLAELVRTQQVSASELLESCIETIGELNPKLNFLVHNLFDRAQEQVKVGLPDGPFKGVPFFLKNLGGAYLNTALSSGSKLFSSYTCQHTDEVVKRFIKTGLVILGRTNSPELGFSFTTEPDLHGPARNPWNLNLSTGGSSGGAAAAVAAGVVPIAHASDGGGSIRVPASCCGLFGLKPSRARVPMGPLQGEAWGGFASHHVLSRSVRDSAAMLDCIAGPELGDPYYAPAKEHSYLNSLERPVGKFRIGVLEQLKPSEAISSEVKKSFSDSLNLLDDLGHNLESIKLSANIDQMRRAFMVIITANLHALFNQLEKDHPRKELIEALEPSNRLLLDLAENHLAADYAQAVQELHIECRKIANDVNHYDVIVTPTTAEVAPELGELASNNHNLAAFNAKQLKFSPYTGLANMTGQPAMSVPLHWTEKNIPIGTHFIAPFGHENILFRLAKQLEIAKPWFDKKPIYPT